MASVEIKSPIVFQAYSPTVNYLAKDGGGYKITLSASEAEREQLVQLFNLQTLKGKMYTVTLQVND